MPFDVIVVLAIAVFVVIFSIICYTVTRRPTLPAEIDLTEEEVQELMRDPDKFMNALSKKK